MQPVHNPPDKAYISATVATGQTKSSVINLFGLELAGFLIPSNFDGTTVSLEMCDTEDGTFVPVNDGAGSAFTLTTSASSYEPITNLPITAGLSFIKVVTGSAQAGSDTEIKLAARQI